MENRSEITNVDIMKIQHDETETVERIEFTMAAGTTSYRVVSAFNFP